MNKLTRDIPAHSILVFLALGFLSLTGIPVQAYGAEDEKNEQESEATHVIPIEVEAKELKVQPGHRKYGEETIQSMPTADGHLSDLLRLNPAVDFSRDSDLSSNNAVLRPGEISIHGQEFYQNLFLIDGIDTSNDLNPASAEDVFAIPSLVAPIGGSSPQGYYIDVNLLKSIEVFDSNISAEHGGFTGGVVEAELKSYEGEDMFSVKFGLKRDEWEAFRVIEGDLTTNDYYNAKYTPDYIKRNFSFAMQREIAEGLGLTLNASRRTSKFGQRYQEYFNRTKGSVWKNIDYEDRIDNVLGRLDTEWRGHDVGVSFRYARRRHDGLTGTRYDGRFEKDHDGYGLTGHFDGRLGGGHLEVNLGVDVLSDELDSEHNVFTYHEYAEATPEDPEYAGSFGDSEQEQLRVSAKPKYAFDSFQYSGVEHNIVVGGELRYTNSHYERPSDVTGNFYWCVDDESGRTGGCEDWDNDGVRGGDDEFLGRVFHYYAGKVDLHYNEMALYVENRMSFSRDYQVTAGLRVDRNSFLENYDVAPRLSMEWNALGHGQTTLIAGVNRYYGRSFMRLELNDAIYGWRERIDYCHPNAASSTQRCTHSKFGDNGQSSLDYSNRSGLSDLDTPYSDEWMLGWTQVLGPVTAKLQYVNRSSKDGISRKYEDQDGDGASDREYYYTNDGRSSTKSYTLDFTNEEPFVLGITENHVTLALNYKETDNNNQSVQTDTITGYDEQIEDEIIYYKGQLISLDQLPAPDYNVPFGARLFTTTRISRWNLTWSNFINWRRGGVIARDTRDDCDDDDIDFCDGDHDIYEDFDFDSAVTVDAKIRWEPKLYGRDLFVKVEINNLFNKTVDTDTSSSDRTYTSGRVWWLEVGAKF